MARGLLAERPEARLWVSLGQAGDRSDEDILNLSQAVWEARPDRVSLREVVGYERGRERGEVRAMMNEKLIQLGQSADKILLHEDEVSSIEGALEWARPDDLIVHLVHIEREAVREVLEQRR